MFFLFVIGFVEPGTFEYYTAPAAYKAVHFSAALRALFYRFGLDALEQVELFLAITALVFVSRHFI